MEKKDMSISRFWPQAAVLTFTIGFAILGSLAALLYSEQPPIPQRVATVEGTILFTRNDVMAGQHLFQEYGLMQLGTLYGHGAYLGPDFTAQYLHLSAQKMLSYYQAQGISSAEAEARVKSDLKANLYDNRTGILVFNPAQSSAFDQLFQYYKKLFGPPAQQAGLSMPYIGDPDSVRQLTTYFAWAAWTTAALRPGKTFSYTNNWPPEPLAGNLLTADSFIWSVSV
jgi:nitric oxide reductase subunit B